MDAISNGKIDSLHQKYLELKKQQNPKNIPWPAIFDIKALGDGDESKIIQFSFEKLKSINDKGIVKQISEATYIFLVKLDEDDPESKEKIS